MTGKKRISSTAVRAAGEIRENSIRKRDGALSPIALDERLDYAEIKKDERQ